MNHPSTDDPGQSSLAAFRADLQAAGRTITPLDDQILTVAAMLRQASIDPSGEGAQRLLGVAGAIATEVVGPRRIARGCFLEDRGDPSPLDIFRLLAELCADRTLYRVDELITDSLAILAPAGSLVAARIQFRRFRRTLFAGNLDQAELLLDGLLAGPLAQFDEIRLRCLIGRGAIARSRGNLPAARAHYEEMLQRAAGGHTQMRAFALNSIGTILASKGDFNAGLEHSWKAYQLVAGSGLEVERVVIMDTSVMLLDAGYPAQARPALASMLHDAVEFELLPLVGGYVEASSKLGDRAGVEWAVKQALLLARRGIHARHTTQTLFECALALKRIGEDTRSETLMRRTLRAAERHGFHDFAFRAQEKVERVIAPLGETAAAIAAQVQEIEPGVRPETLEHVG